MEIQNLQEKAFKPGKPRRVHSIEAVNRKGEIPIIVLNEYDRGT